MSLDLFNYGSWKPFARFGAQGPFWTVHSHTIVATWIMIGAIAALIILIRLLLAAKNSYVRYLSFAYVQSFIDLTQQAIGSFVYRYTVMIATIFTFVLSSSLISLIPGVEEPAKDLNTTLAIGLISFLYNQTQAIKAHGVIEYIKEYFAPFFLMFPLHIIGAAASIVSISFRLFGNIFGGAVISALYKGALGGILKWEIFGIISGLNILISVFFVLFEGFIQAFIFSMLSLTYLAIGIQSKHEQDE